MSRKAYADEATLTAHLDKLLSTATSPTQAESVYSDTTITVDHLLSGHLLANENLSTLGLQSLPPLPSKPETRPCDELLAAAFTAIVKLSQCAVANKNLREGAESSLRACTARIEGLSARAGAAEARAKKKDVTILSLRNAAEDVAARHRAQLKKLSAESAQLRSRLLHASHRENQLVLAGKKREKEFGQLQTRVHALFKTAAPIEQRITRVGNRESPRGGESLEADVAQLGGERVEAVEGENDVLRGLLQAVQEELDDLILLHGESASVVSEELDVPPAPGDEVMQLPLDVIGDDLQDSLERKFGILRKALQRSGRDAEFEEGDHTEFVDGCDETDYDAMGQTEDRDRGSPNSAHRSVDETSDSKDETAEDSELVQLEAEVESDLAEAEEVGKDANDEAAGPSPTVDTFGSVHEVLDSPNQAIETDLASPVESGMNPVPVDAAPPSENERADTTNDATTATTDGKAKAIHETLDALNSLSLTGPTGAPSDPHPSNR